MQGWIKLHRRMMDRDSTFFKLTAIQKLIAIYIVLNANHKDGVWRDRYKNIEVPVKRGQLVVSRNTIKSWFGNDKDVTDRKIRTALSRLEDVGFMSKQPTKNYTLLTVLNYCVYQDTEEESDQANDQEVTKRRPRNDQGTSLNKNDKNVNNDQENINICASSDARLDNTDFYGSKNKGGRAAGQDLDGSVEAGQVTATSSEQLTKTIFSSRKMQEMFDAFWREYPKRRAKGNAEKAFAKIKPSEQLFEVIVDGLKRAKTSVEWQKDGGQYIPYPASWLNAKGWEDEYNPPEQEGDRPRVDPALLEEYVRTATIHFGMKLEEFMDEGLSFEEAFFEIERMEYMPEFPEIKQRALENIKKIRLAG